VNLTYPAIITYEDNVFYIGFPDFEKEFYNTYGDTFEEAVEMGKEYLVLLLEELENEKKEFPAPSKIKKVKELLEDNQELVYISLNYEYEKSLVKIAYVKKTLTIPSYLDILAKNKNINFSQVLQEALKEKLLIK
jgi:predicted RNase H-like HicB family nuclease